MGQVLTHQLGWFVQVGCFFTWSALMWAAPCTAQSGISGREPIGVRDQYPLSAVHYDWSVRSAHLKSEGEVEVVTRYILGSNNAGNEAYIVDAESRELSLQLRYGVTSRIELDLELPIRWQGGGVFDNVIEEWHDVFGLPQGGRDEIDHDRFQIFGDLSSGGRFEIDNSGTHIGNPVAVFRFAALSSPLPLTVDSVISFPDIDSGASHKGVNLGLGATSGFRAGDFRLNYGIAAIYASDPVYQELRYRRWWGQGFSNLEWVFEDYSIFASLFYSTGKVDNVLNHNHHALYLDIGISGEISQRSKIEFLIRENIDPGDGTSDFSVLLGVRADFSRIE